MLQVGRQMNYQSIDDRTWRVFFRPALPEAAMPIAIFRDALFWNAVRTLFMSMHTAEGLPVKIKLFGRTLCQVSLSFDLACETFLLALQHIRQLHPRRGNPSLHASGKRCGDICTIRDIHSRLNWHINSPCFAYRHANFGGGTDHQASHFQDGLSQIGAI